MAAEFILLTRPEDEREPLHAALDAASVLHWFDASLLARMLEIPMDEAGRRFETLASLPFIERYGRAELNQRNIHESTRLGWRQKLYSESLPHFRRPVRPRAAACFTDDLRAPGRIEWVYHLLCADPEHGATELEHLNRHWTSSARPEDRYVLATVLRELEDTRLVEGRARLWSLITIAWVRQVRGETAQLADAACEILDLARANADEPAQAEAQCLLGDVFLAQGNLSSAQAAFEQDLAIFRRLAEQDPSNAGWQRDLAAAYVRVARIEARNGSLVGPPLGGQEGPTLLPMPVSP